MNLIDPKAARHEWDKERAMMLREITEAAESILRAVHAARPGSSDDEACPHGNIPFYPAHGWWCDACFERLEQAVMTARAALDEQGEEAPLSQTQILWYIEQVRHEVRSGGEVIKALEIFEREVKERQGKVLAVVDGWANLGALDGDKVADGCVFVVSPIKAIFPDAVRVTIARREKSDD